MKPGLAKKILKGFGIFYYVAALFLLILGIVAFTLKESDVLSRASDELLKVVPNDMKITTFLGIFVIVIALLELATGYLLRRAAKDGKKTTLLLVLLVLSVIGSVTNLFTNGTGESIATLILNVVIDGLLLYSTYVVRKEAE